VKGIEPSSQRVRVLFPFIKSSGDGNAIANMMSKNTICHHKG